MPEKARQTSPKLLSVLEAARLHQMTPQEIEAQRRSWVIGELMLDDPDLTRADANKLYDQVTAEQLMEGQTIG